MKSRYLLTAAVLLVLFKGGFSQGQTPARIIHVPVVSLKSNDNLFVEARVDGSSQRVAFMRLYFKSDSEDTYQYIEMTGSLSGYIGELPASRFTPPTLDYFILCFLNDQSVVTYPAVNPYGNPVMVSVSGRMGSARPPSGQLPPTPTPGLEDKPRPNFTPELAQQAQRPLDQPGELSAILILSPEEGETFNLGDDIVIAASFLPNEPMDMNSINITVDGFDVKPESAINENLLTYTTSDLPPGKHRVIIRGYYTSGLPLPTTIWSFEVLGESSRQRSRVASSFRGRAFAETRHENLSGVGFSDNNIGGQLTGKYGVTRYDARLFLTTRESNAFQPRNRFSFSLDLGPLGATVGDIYPRFNDLMLWGKRVRGFHGRLHLGLINFDFLTGQTLRATPVTIQPLLDPTGQPVLDPLTGAAVQDTIPSGTFKQNLLGARVSFGGGRNFQLGFNVLKVRDDTTSLKAGEFSALPQDNLVAGSDILIAFDNRRFEIRGSVAASLVSTDISGGSITRTEIEDQFDVELPFDPADFSKYFIINASTTPLDPRDLTSVAYNFSFRLNYFNNNFQFGYKTIGSEYVSLGHSLVRSNLRGFFFQDRMRLYQNKIYLNLGFEDYKDNFNPGDENPITKLQTLNYGLSFFPGRGLPNLTLSMREHHRDNDVDTVAVDFSGGGVVPIYTDTRENNKSKDFTLQVNYDVNLLNVNHAVSLSFITSDRKDLFNEQSRLLAGIPSTNNSSNVQVVSLRTTYQIPLTTTFNFARNDNNFAAGLSTFNFKMFGARADYHFMNRRLQTHFGTNYTSASGKSAIDPSVDTSITDYNRLQFNLGARFEITPGHFFLLDSGLVKFNDNGGTFDTNGILIPNPSFTDRIFRLYYEKRF